MIIGCATTRNLLGLPSISPIILWLPNSLIMPGIGHTVPLMTGNIREINVWRNGGELPWPMLPATEARFWFAEFVGFFRR